jgi:glycerol uptake facilitator-like aquaporin
MSLWRRGVAEFVATALLLAVVVGSGIMGERLAGGNTAVALLANSIATGCGLVALIVTFGPASGAHMNPIVTVALSMVGRHAGRDIPVYVVAQCAGAIAGVWIAHAMFAMPILEASTKVRAGFPQMFAEGVATFGLLIVILGGLRHRPESIPFTVGCYIRDSPRGRDRVHGRADHRCRRGCLVRRRSISINPELQIAGIRGCANARCRRDRARNS